MNGIARICLSIALTTTSLVGCVTEPTEEIEPASDVLLGTEDLVAIPRATSVEELVERTSKNLRSNGSGSFYLAIRRSALSGRWFWSTYLEQLQPYGPSPGTLGTRVVRFREQNGRLFVFDADDRRSTSDIFEPDLIIDSFEIVDHGAFHALPGSGGFILIDPSAGRNRFGALADWWAEGAKPVKLETELSFVEDFKSWNDGGSFAHVFASYSNEPIGTPGDVDINEFRVAATTRVTLRRYYETAGYTPTTNPGVPHFFTSNPLEFNSGSPVVHENAVHWAFHPGMQPIKWKIGRGILQYQNDPAFGGADLVGAIERGIESWNSVFGYEVFDAELAGPNEHRFGDDHYNYFIVDTDASLGFAYADWRTNPNTGEVRGASVYFSGAFFSPFPDDVAPATDAPARPRMKRKAVPRLVWQDQASTPLCVRYADERRATDGVTGLTGTQKLENYIQEVALHEIGHVLGLRHNFKGSLVPPTSSTMEYNVADVSFVQPVPGPYDVDAIRYLYGLSPNLPAQPFCTDEDTLVDPNCVRFDEPSPTPLYDYQLPWYTFIASLFLDGSLPVEQADLYVGAYGLETMGYARGGDATESNAAWSSLVGGYCDFVGPNAGADAVCRFWFRDLVRPQGAIANSITDADVLAQIAIDGRSTIQNGDRDFTVRRAAVDALRSMQNLGSYEALLGARETLAGQLPSLTGAQAALTRDLVARIDAATTPYFQ
ncbi:MAG: zinc-dependent metalloprotease [Kofleriaceae bacterium]